MVRAELANKIRPDTDITRSEDILTSIVFGSLRYLNPYELLIPFLSKSVQAFDKAMLGSILNNRIPFDSVKYYFWPKFENGKEPDMVILFDNSRKKREPNHYA